MVELGAIYKLCVSVCLCVYVSVCVSLCTALLNVCLYGSFEESSVT